VGDPEKVVDLEAIQAELKAQQTKRAEAKASGYESAFGEQAKRSKEERDRKAREEKPKPEEPKAEFKEAPKAKTKFDEALEEEIVIEAEPKAEEEEEAEDEGPKLDGKFSKTIKPTIVITSKVWTHPKFMMIVERSLLHLNDASAGIYQRGNILVRSIEEWGKGVRGERVKVCKLVGMTEKNLERKRPTAIRWAVRSQRMHWRCEGIGHSL
jgi:hypothetical protein